MLYLGLCQTRELDVGHLAAATLVTRNLTTATAVSVVHTAAMIASGWRYRRQSMARTHVHLTH